MTKMNWDKSNKLAKANYVHVDDVSFQDSKEYKSILDFEELIKHKEMFSDGPYKTSILEEEYAKSGFKSRIEFEDYLLMNLKEEQEKARQETCVLTNFNGGKYKGFSYKEVWKAKPEYILWVYFRGRISEHKKRVLQNIDLANEIVSQFVKCV